MLSEAQLPADPLELVSAWYDEALRTAVPMADAMALATSTADAMPSARMVLYKGTSNGGIEFFTNYESRKARELAANPRAAAILYWPALARQIRLEGRVERLSEAESNRYFATRDRDSQLGAWASPQSQAIGSRDELERRFREIAARYPPDQPVPRPPFWGGYRLIPELIEFWISRPSRLHDRFRYSRDGIGWRIERLAP